MRNPFDVFATPYKQPRSERDVQRAMVAALYYRAGEAKCEGERALKRMVVDDISFAESHVAYIMRNRAEWLFLAHVASDMWDALNTPTYKPVMAR